jgi:hypothetical protein
MNTGCWKASNPVFSKPPDVTVGLFVAVVVYWYSSVPLVVETEMSVPAGTVPET